MALFRRKSNHPSGNDLPPELKPYYNADSAGAKARRSALRAVLGLLVLAIIVAGGLVAWRYIRTHPHALQIATSRKTPASPAPQTSTDNNASPQKVTPNNPSTSQPTTGQSSVGSLPGDSNNQSAPSTAAPNPTTNSAPPPATAPVAPNQTAASTTTQPLTNTGPGETMLVAVLSSATLGAAFYHFRQARHARR